LLRGKVVGRYILEALMCGAHLQTYSDKDIRRIMYLCPNIAGYPGTKLLSLVWERRMCEHLQTSATWAAFQVLEKAIAEEIPADRPKRKPGQEGRARLPHGTLEK